MTPPAHVERLLTTARWIAKVRLFAVAFAAIEVGVLSTGYPPGYEAAAWVVTVVFAAGALAIFLFAGGERTRAPRTLALAGLVFDTVVISAYAFVYSYEYGNQTRFALIFAVAEAALCFGLRGGIVLPLLTSIPLAFVEWWRVDRFGDEPGAPGFLADRITFPVGVLLLLGLILGRLVDRLAREADVREERAREAETSRDELGQRADLLDGITRCARAIGSSLDLDEAFGAFIRELRGVAAFDRVAIVLSEGDRGSVMATAGAGIESTFPAGTEVRVSGTIMSEVLRSGRVAYRADLTEPQYAEERLLLAAGLRSRVVAPLLAGTSAIGILALSRSAVDGFDPREVELIELLGRVVGASVQNIRAFNAERETVDELRRLSSLRADFVSLVSHELRSPMAAVIGAARTLQSRWREMSPNQRESFLALIADETTRLAALIGDVLDTSRIDAGTFSIRFAEVDLVALASDCAMAAAVAQDDVPVAARVRGEVPLVRGDGERLRQVLVNLIDNAVKYSPHGEVVEVESSARNGSVVVAVTDRGPGIAPEHHRLVFEKFGRVSNGASKPGTGLGLFIARSIVEAHGGTLELRSVPGRGATFSFSLPSR